MFTRAVSDWIRGPFARLRKIPRWARLTAAVVVLLVFRKAIAWLLVGLLASAFGLGWKMPRFEWPWSGTPVVRTVTTNIDLGPMILQKVEGISRPALGQANFTFTFTHKVDKSLGFWPCWYQATFYAVARAYATVDLNPGPAWWKHHYRLQVHGKAVGISMDLPVPALPQSADDVVVDNIPSQPIASDHSWTYPGFGCGVILRPQFAPTILYGLAQQMAYWRVVHLPDIAGPLIASAESQAVLTIRDSYVQPALNALGYRLDRFTINWVKGG